MDRKLLDYLPPVLQEVLEFQAINGANEPELSMAWDALTLVLANQFLETADTCVVQGIFLHMVENREKFTSIDNLKAYLYQTTQNRCLKQLRHEGVKQRYIFESQAVEEEAFYLDHILEEEVYVLLMRAIDSLPLQCRKVFRLVLENKSNQEIAEILSINIETVKSYKKQGKALLYKRLKGIVPLVLLTFWLQF